MSLTIDKLHEQLMHGLLSNHSHSLYKIFHSCQTFQQKIRRQGVRMNILKYNVTESNNDKDFQNPFNRNKRASCE